MKGIIYGIPFGLSLWAILVGSVVGWPKVIAAGWLALFALCLAVAVLSSRDIATGRDEA